MMADKEKIEVDFGGVKFELMASGAILVTVYWNGSEAQLSRSRQIEAPSRFASQPTDNFTRLQELLEDAKKLRFPVRRPG